MPSKLRPVAEEEMMLEIEEYKVNEGSKQNCLDSQVMKFFYENHLCTIGWPKLLKKTPKKREELTITVWHLIALILKNKISVKRKSENLKKNNKNIMAF